MLDDYKEIQPIVYRILKNSVLKNKNSHAYLFETRGYPRQMDVALAFAKYLFCPKKQTNLDYCEGCNLCKRIEDGNFTELKIIEPDGFWIKKEQLAELQEEFSKKSVESNKKVYIINHAEKLNTAAANSILKFLEEPEENIVAILLVDNLYQLLDTIVSRCQVVSFAKVKSVEMQQHYGTDNETLFKVGSFLVDNDEALKKFITDEKNVEKLDKIVKFLLYFENHGRDILLFMNKMWLQEFKEKEELEKAFLIIELFYKDVLNYLLKRPIDIMKDYEKEIEQISIKNDIITISQKLTIVLEEAKKIQANINTNLLMDKLMIRLLEVK